MTLTPRTIVLFNVGAALFFVLLIAATLIFQQAASQPPLYLSQGAADSTRTIDSYKDIDELRRYAKLQVELRDTHSQVVDALLVRIRTTTLWLCAIAAGLFALGAWMAYVSSRSGGTGGVRSNTTPHADARDVPASASGSGARAGGRER
jgi:hypothetical protein